MPPATFFGSRHSPSEVYFEGNSMNNEEEVPLPDSVKAALSSRYGTVPSVPAEVDAAILADARQHFQQHGPASQRPRRWRRFATWQWTAIASSIAAACVAFVVWQPQENLNEQFADIGATQQSQNSDVDRNGRIDILDAFVLARQMRDGIGNGHDINHDGRFDQLDIDIVARESVKL